MRDGFVKIAAGTPNIRVADCMYNAEQIVALMKEAAAQGVKVLALPELCITAYTCADLFLQPVLLQGAERALEYILNETSDLDLIAAVGMPIRAAVNCTAAPWCSLAGKFWVWCLRATSPTTASSTRPAGLSPARMWMQRSPSVTRPSP